MADLKGGNKLVLSALCVWLALAIAIAASGFTSSWRPPLPQVVLITLTIASLAAVFLLPVLRDWMDTVPVRALVAWHLTRLVAGGYFLVLANEGSLSRTFALPAGWGDIAVALTAAGLLLSLKPASEWERRCYLIWNVFGLLDIVLVVVNAARIGLAAPSSMAPLLRLPLSILPTFLVPTIIASHIILFRRLSRRSD